MKGTGVTLIVLAMTVPASTRAQSWSFLPNGELGYTTPYTTTGFFTCDPYHYGLVGSTCSASGNQILFTAPGGTSQIVFNGITSTLTASNTLGTVLMGNMQFEDTGSGAPYPLTPYFAHTAPSFLFTMALQGGGVFVRGYTDQGFNCCQGLPRYIVLGVATPPPSPYTYEAVVFEPIFWPPDADGNIYATIALVPEPGSLLFVATGLLGMCGIGIRRRGAKR